MSPVRIRVVQDFPAPVGEAFAWLTDFQDDDGARAGAVIASRRVVERAPNRVVYEGETMALGVRIWARTLVTLAPPDRWEARVTAGPRTGSSTRYHVVPTASGSRVTVDYEFVVDDRLRMLVLRVARALVARDLRRMWAGYAASFEEEARASSPGPAPAVRAAP